MKTKIEDEQRWLEHQFYGLRVCEKEISPFALRTVLEALKGTVVGDQTELLDLTIEGGPVVLGVVSTKPHFYVVTEPAKGFDKRMRQGPLKDLYEAAEGLRQAEQAGLK